MESPTAWASTARSRAFTLASSLPRAPVHRAERLGFHVESLALQRSAIDRHEAGHMQYLPGLHVCFRPILNLSVAAFPACRGALRDDLAPLVPHERISLETSN